MKLDEIVSDSEQTMLAGLYSGIQHIRIIPFFESWYRDSFPSSLKPYFEDDYERLQKLALDIDIDIQELAQEKLSYYEQHPDKLLDTTLRSLLQFDEPEKQLKFSQDITYRIEEFAVAVESAAYKAYEIIDVKRNTPGIRYFANKKIDAWGGLPSFEETCATIYGQKNRLLQVWDNIDSHAVDKDANLDNIMQDDEPVFDLSFENQKASSPIPLQDRLYGQKRPLSRKEQFHQDMSYSFSPYNNFLETCIGAIGSATHYVLGSVCDMLFS